MPQARSVTVARGDASLSSRLREALDSAGASAGVLDAAMASQSLFGAKKVWLPPPRFG